MAKVIFVMCLLELSAGQQLHLKGFSGSLYDQIVRNFAPTLGVEPEFLGVTNRPVQPVQQTFANQGSFHGGSFGGNADVQNLLRSILGASSSSQNQLQTPSNQLSWQRSNPTQHSHHFHQNQPSSHPQAQPNADFSSQLLQYLALLGQQGQQPSSLDQLLLQQYQTTQPRTTTTTTTTTPAPPPPPAPMGQFQALYQQAKGNPAMMQHLFKLMRLQLFGEPTTTPAPEPAGRQINIEHIGLLQRSPRFPHPTEPPSTSFSQFGGQRSPAEMRAFLQRHLQGSTSWPSTTTTTMPPTTSTLPPTTTTTSRPAFSRPSIQQFSHLNQDPKMYAEFLAFLEHRRRGTASVQDNQIITEKMTPVTLPTTVLTTLSTPNTPELTTTSESTTVAATTTVALNAMGTRTQDIQSALQSLKGSSPLLKNLKGMGAETSSDERRILKQVLSRVLNSLLAEESAATDATAASSTVQTTTPIPMITTAINIATAQDEAIDRSETVKSGNVTELSLPSFTEDVIIGEQFLELVQGQSLKSEAVHETIEQSGLLSLNNEHAGLKEPFLITQQAELQGVDKETQGQDQGSKSETAVVPHEAESLSQLLSVLQGSTPDSTNLVLDNQVALDKATAQPQSESEVAASEVQLLNEDNVQTQEHLELSEGPTTPSPSPEPDFWFNHLLTLTGITAASPAEHIPDATTPTTPPADVKESANVFGDIQQRQDTPVEAEVPSRTWTSEFDQLTRLQQLQQNQQMLDQFEAQRQLVLGNQQGQENTQDVMQNQVTDITSAGQPAQGQVLTESTPGLTEHGEAEVRNVGRLQNQQQPVQDTPEVAAAREAHLKEVDRIRAEQLRREVLKELIAATVLQSKSRRR